MSSLYPEALDALKTTHVDDANEPILAEDINAQADAVNKVEAALGVNPQGAYADVAARLAALEQVIPTSTVAGTSYTFALTDAGTCVAFTSDTSPTATVPDDATADFPIGSYFEAYQAGAGTLTIAAGAGVTLHSPDGVLQAGAQFATLLLRKIAANEWVVSGELALRSPDLFELLLSKLGLVSATYDPRQQDAAGTADTQELYMLGVPLRKGQQLTGLKLCIGTAAVGADPSGAWVGLADETGVVLVKSANLLSADTISDTFTRTIAVGGGWGNADSGQAWTTYNSITTPNAANFGVDGAEASAALNVAGADRTALVALEHTDIDVLVRFKHTAAPVGDSVNYRVCARMSDNRNGYRAVVNVDPTNLALLNIVKAVDNVETQLLAADVNMGNLTVGSWYWLRLHATGTTLEAKMWADGSAEPAAYNATVDDATYASGAAVGVSGRANAANTNLPTVNFDDFTVQDLAAATGSFAATGVQEFGFGTTYEVPDDGFYWALFLIDGTWVTTQPTFYRTYNNAFQGEVMLDARLGGQTAIPDVGQSIVGFVSDGAIRHWWVGCVGS